MFGDEPSAAEPSASPQQLASAIADCIDAGARLVNLSVGIAGHSGSGETALHDALDRAAASGVIVVAAAGNQRSVGSSLITRHPWVLAVVACDLQGRPTRETNLGSSIARHGLRAPGEGIVGLGPDGGTSTLAGTSVAVPFVTGAAALLWSRFPGVSAAHLRAALTRAPERRSSIVPPLLDAANSFALLARSVPHRWAA